MSEANPTKGQTNPDPFTTGGRKRDRKTKRPRAH